MALIREKKPVKVFPGRTGRRRYEPGVSISCVQEGLHVLYGSVKSLLGETIRLGAEGKTGRGGVCKKKKERSCCEKGRF